MCSNVLWLHVLWRVQGGTGGPSLTLLAQALADVVASLGMRLDTYALGPVAHALGKSYVVAMGFIHPYSGSRM
jgi:hypothetical protein